MNLRLKYLLGSCREINLVSFLLKEFHRSAPTLLHGPLRASHPISHLILTLASWERSYASPVSWVRGPLQRREV